MRAHSERTRWFDRVSSVLSDHDRRRVLRLLRDHGGPMTIDELARAVDETRDAASTGSEGATAVSLYHVHLPKLADAGLVQFDDGSDAVRCADLPTAVESLLASSASLDYGVDRP